MQASLDHKPRSDERNRDLSVKDFHYIVSLYASDYDSDFGSISSENQPLAFKETGSAREIYRTLPCGLDNIKERAQKPHGKGSIFLLRLFFFDFVFACTFSLCIL